MQNRAAHTPKLTQIELILRDLDTLADALTDETKQGHAGSLLTNIRQQALALRADVKHDRRRSVRKVDQGDILNAARMAVRYGVNTVPFVEGR